MFKQCYDIVRNRAGFVDLSDEGHIKVSGDDAEEFLHYLVGSSILDLPEGRMTNTLFADENGHLVSTVWVVRFDTFFLIVCDEEDKERTIAHIRSKSDDKKLHIEDMNGSMFDIGLMGPEAEAIVADIFDDEIYTVAFQSWLELDGCWFVRYGSCGEYEIHIIGPNDKKDEMLARLGKGSTEGKFESVNKAVLSVLTTEMRHLHRLPHIPEGISIYQAGIQWMIDFTKDDFCGKAALQAQRDQPDPKGVLLSIEGEEFGAMLGQSLSIENRELGKIVCAYPSYSMGGCVAFAYIEDEFAFPGLSYQVANGTAAKSISSPAFLTRSVLNTIN